jgi:hypothetical protein
MRRIWTWVLVSWLVMVGGACTVDNPVADDAGTGGGTSALCRDVPADVVCVFGQLERGDSDDLGDVSVSVLGQPAMLIMSEDDGSFALLLDTTVSPVTTTGTSAEESDEPIDDAEYTLLMDDTDAQFGRAIQVDPSMAGEQGLDLGTVEILPAGSIRGRVTLAGKTDHTGIQVYLPGTSYLATTAADGQFVMSSVPPGAYPFLRAEKDGYRFAIVAEIAVPSAAAITLEPIELGLDTGAEGTVGFSGVVQDGQGAYSTEATVVLDLNATDGAVLVMVSENEDFKGATWQPIETQLSYTFDGDGTHTVYVKFADANGLESSPVSATITIDGDPKVQLLAPMGVTSASLPVIDWSDTRIPEATYRLQVARDGSFEDLVVDVDEVDASVFALMGEPLEEGQAYFARVVIEDGKSRSWSSTLTFTVDLGAVSTLTPQGVQSSSRPTLDWDDSTLGGATYRLQLADNPEFDAPLVDASDLSNSQYTVTESLEQGETYYFRVAVVDEHDVQGAWAGPATFELDLGNVALALPVDDTLTNDTAPTFSWDMNPAAASYVLHYGTDADLVGATQISDIAGTVHTLAGALPDAALTTYYWAVTPVDEHGVAGTRSSIRSFRLDTQAPSGTLTINDGDATTHDEVVSVALLGSDPSGPIEIMVTKVDPDVSATWVVTEDPVVLDYSELASTGTATITAYGYLRDAAGNVSELQTDTIELQRTLVPAAAINANTTWLAAQSPYYVTGDVIVLNPATLTLEAGVTVYFKTGRKLEIRSGGDVGEAGLYAAGSGGSPITLHGARIELNYATDWVNAGRGSMHDGAGNYVKGPFFDHVTMTDGTIQVRISTFDGPGFYMTNSSLGTLTADFFGYVLGTYLARSTVTNIGTEGQSLNLDGSQILNSYVTSMYVEGYSSDQGVKIEHCDIDMLSIDRWVPTKSSLSYNELGTLHWTRPSTTNSAELHNNNFVGLGALLTLGADSGSTGLDVDATGNYWGPTATAQMQASQQNITAIHDFFDDTNLMIVDFSGYLTTPVADAGPDW